ncbi:MAG TPA: HAMP domain-containing sensor histidine kinase, partial [Caldilineaceae bacterium]|nr:HAMP domain-containing sensor histidine kinase [Caldilineaceae bacterium]
MPKKAIVASPAKTPEVQSALRELQEEVILMALPGLYVAGIGLILGVGLFRPALHGAAPGLLLLGLAGAVWYLRRLNYLLAAWLLVIGVFAAAGLLLFWADLPTSLGLLALPIGLATLLVGAIAGVASAVGASALILLSPPPLATDASEQFVALALLWGVFWLIWLTSHSMLTVMIWFQSSYEQSRALLEAARDHQQELSQTLQDLADANLQLSRLHRLANSMRQLAEDARRAKEQFVANVSHELRTPLNMIIGFTEMILQAPHTYGHSIPQSLLADLEIVRRNSQHLSSLIDDVLDLSHIETGQMALTKERVQIDDIVKAATAAVRPLYESKGLMLSVDIPPDLPPLFCDPVRIRQVLLNLLSNAGRFTDKGSVQVMARMETGSLVVSVSDTGPGIAEGDLQKLFQPFQQLDSSIRRQHGGSGLGLSISKAFIELHGGKMWVESHRGVGTT